MLEEAEVVVGAEGVVVVCHDIGKGEGDIATSDNLFALLSLVRQLFDA